MPPFNEPYPILSSFKEKIDSLTVQGDRLFLGTSTGNLHVYNIDIDESGQYRTTIVKTKNLSKKPIENVGYIKDINSVVALSDSIVTLYPLPDLIPPTPLPQSRKAFTFSVSSTVEKISADGKVQSFDDVASPSQGPWVPTVVTYLVIGSQRKLVVYSWRDGEVQDVKEAPLPHSARIITFIKPTVLCLAYTATEHVLFYLETMTTSDLTMPLSIPSSTSAEAYGMKALTGLGGYMTLGLVAKAKPLALTIGEDVLIPKDGLGMFFSADGKAKPDTLTWNAPPEDLTFTKPYVLSLQSAGTVPASSVNTDTSLPIGPTGFVQAPMIQVQSSLTFQDVQFLLVPNSLPSSSALRFLTSSPGGKAPVFVVSTPTDRNAAITEGSSIWALCMKSWGEQIDELVDNEKYSDALALLESIEEATLPDKVIRRAKLRALLAVSQFKAGEFDDAMNAFITLDINPAKVVALYPEAVSGRLHIPSEKWIALYGGPESKQPASSEIAEGAKTSRPPSVARTPSPAGSLRPRRRGTLDTILGSGERAPDNDEDRVSLRGRIKKTADTFPRSLEALLKYLTDRRPKLGGALGALSITPAQAHQFPFLSETSTEDLFSLPDASLPSLTPEQLTRFAQIVDTALFKTYLIVRPGLLGPLCSVDNWCEVTEVEEVLMEREKFSELVSLYRGHKMHGNALKLLRQLSEKEDDIDDKIRPTVSYVQKLGPDYLDQVFDAAKWVYQYKHNTALEIFTAELVDLPRSKVADFLEEDLDPQICAKYLEYLIAERDEVSTLFHDRLAELYLEIAIKARKDDSYQEAYAKLLEFIQNSDIYRVDRLFGLLPSDDMFEARAILLGRLGKHEAALETYVYRLLDYIKAEEYCLSIYMPNSPTKDIFLSLLKIYLEPSPTARQQHAGNLLKPALDLISRQSSRLDTLETLRLLPPLVPAKDIRAFLYDAVRAPVFDTHVVRELRKGRNEQVGRKLAALQNRRVRVTDVRICPQCHKRLGNSVIAVHAPKGEVTHYQCREAFAEMKSNPGRKH